MKLSLDQIWVYNQRRAIPDDQRLYVTVGLVSSRVYGNNKIQLPTVDGLQDSMTTYVSELISIDLLSYTTEAAEKYFEVLAVLRSTYSQQVQEALGLKISEVPSSVSDVSAVEGAAILFRINITLNVWRKYDKIMDSQYYDTFSYDDLLIDQ
jgi:hypothetical protein